MPSLRLYPRVPEAPIRTWTPPWGAGGLIYRLGPRPGVLFSGVTVAVGWSGYFRGLLSTRGVHLPDALAMSPLRSITIIGCSRRAPSSTCPLLP